MNSVHLIGRLTKDPELQYGSEGKTAYCSFTIAIDRGKDRNGQALDPYFPRITCFGKTAENMSKFVQKGNLICVEGEIRTGKYDKSGKTFYTTDIIAQNVQFLQWKKREKLDETNAESDEEFVPEEAPGFEKLTDDDIPF